MRYFITGTDTDVGKTVACAWAMLHTRARYWKPVQAGLEETDEATIRALTEAGDERFIATTYSCPNRSRRMRPQSAPAWSSRWIISNSQTTMSRSLSRAPAGLWCR